MYMVSVESHFDAAHFLRNYNGKCENLHGHRYKIVVKVSTEKLNEIGLAYDFTDLKKHLNDICERYDHTCLNDVPPFDKINASSENLASTIYKELKTKLAADPVKMVSVAAFETPYQGVIYTE